MSEAGPNDPAPVPTGPDANRRVLLRCPTRTNFLCPCGYAARALKRHGLEFETRRVPYRRSERPEIEELTKQRRVPVLVDGDEVVHDSRRIAEYLEWRYGNADKD